MKSRLIVVGLFLAVAMGIVMTSVSAAQAACTLIVIQGRSGVTPPSASLNAGDCVVFMNFTGSASSMTEEVKVLYKAGESCLKASYAAVGFDLDQNKCLTTGWLKYGQTATVGFTQSGTYNFDVYFKEGGPSINGTITVK